MSNTRSRSLYAISPYALSFARPVVYWPENLHLHDDAGLYEQLMGCDSYPEAFTSIEMRDAKLGMATEHVNFEPADWARAEAGGFTWSHIAVGPAVEEEGFTAIAPRVLKAMVDEWLDFDLDGDLYGKIIIARVGYNFFVDFDKKITVHVHSLYGKIEDIAFEATVEWLEKSLRELLSNSYIRI